MELVSVRDICLNIIYSKFRVGRRRAGVAVQPFLRICQLGRFEKSRSFWSVLITVTYCERKLTHRKEKHRTKFWESACSCLVNRMQDRVVT